MSTFGKPTAIQQKAIDIMDALLTPRCGKSWLIAYLFNRDNGAKSIFSKKVKQRQSGLLDIKLGDMMEGHHKRDAQDINNVDALVIKHSKNNQDLLDNFSTILSKLEEIIGKVNKHSGQISRINDDINSGNSITHELLHAVKAIKDDYDLQKLADSGDEDKFILTRFDVKQFIATEYYSSKDLDALPFEYRAVLEKFIQHLYDELDHCDYTDQLIHFHKNKIKDPPVEVTNFIRRVYAKFGVVKD